MVSIKIKFAVYSETLKTEINTSTDTVLGLIGPATDTVVKRKISTPRVEFNSLAAVADFAPHLILKKSE